MSYSESHKDRGDQYDGYLAGNAFDNYMAVWEARRVREIVNRLFPGGVPRYLDFACGTGRMTSVIAALAQHVTGVDVSESMLAHARNKLPAVRFVCADITKSTADIGAEKFDLVSAFRFFGNAEHELRLEVLHALGKLLPPGGYLLINNHRNPGSVAARLRLLAGGHSELDLTRRCAQPGSRSCSGGQ
jgi:SAM-dependent methyltransferase